MAREEERGGGKQVRSAGWRERGEDDDRAAPLVLVVGWSFVTVSIPTYGESLIVGVT